MNQERIAPDENEHLIDLQREQLEASARVEGFAKFLVKRYKLAEGDRIENDGTIMRVQQPDA